MSHNVRKHLHLGNQAYDEAIRMWLPGYETMLDIAADAIAAVEPELVLDLGAGTGALSEAILERPRVGAVELLDVDPEMMDQARHRLERFGTRARFTMRSYDEPLSPADAVVASLALHHIPTLEAKSVLFASIFSALRAGGVFVNADVNMPVDRDEQDRLYSYWAEYMVERGVPEERAWQYFQEWSEEDTYLPLDSELTELVRVGFEAQCVWQDGPVGVVVAKKVLGSQRPGTESRS